MPARSVFGDRLAALASLLVGKYQGPLLEGHVGASLSTNKRKPAISALTTPR